MLQYTHGYGFAMSLAAQEGEEGTPTLVVKDLPPVATRGAPVGNPAIYYDENMPGYVIAPSGIRELDYPSGDDNVYASWALLFTSPDQWFRDSLACVVSGGGDDEAAWTVRR